MGYEGEIREANAATRRIAAEVAKRNAATIIRAQVAAVDAAAGKVTLQREGNDAADPAGVPHLCSYSPKVGDWVYALKQMNKAFVLGKRMPPYGGGGMEPLWQTPDREWVDWGFTKTYTHGLGRMPRLVSGRRYASNTATESDPLPTGDGDLYVSGMTDTDITVYNASSTMQYFELEIWA